MIALPGYIDPEVWAAYVQMRKEKGKRAPFTDFAAKLILTKLDRLKAQGNPPNEVLAESIMNGWSGVFALKHIQAPQAAAHVVKPDDTQRYLSELEAHKPRPMPEHLRRRLS